MMNKNERMNKLANAGVNTQKYFNIDLPNGLQPGATISLVINENGQPVIVDKNDVIAEQIIENGYVRNTKLHRRFVMAQMFQMLNYVSYDGKHKGYNDCLKMRYGYSYTFKMMLEEVRVLSKLGMSDVESFIERSHFFTKDVVVEVMNDYIEKLKNYIDNLPSKNCKGVPYKRIKGVDVFVADLDKKVYRPLQERARRVLYARNYIEVYGHLKRFMDDMIKLPYYTPKSKAWVDAFKGEGAYYTLKNLVMYHDCTLPIGYMSMISGNAMEHLKNVLDQYQGEGWRMFALMKKVIKDNNFDFNKRLSEIYND